MIQKSLHKQEESIRLFKWPWLEALTHTHPIVPFFLWGPVSVLFFFTAADDAQFSFFLFLVALILGLLAWSLTEYVMHRFLFHFEAQNKHAQQLLFIVHGIHHKQPQDPTRLVMPPAPSIALAFVFYSLFSFIMSGAFLSAFFASYILGYLIYDYTHYACHHFQFKKGIGKFLQKNHLQHHYQNSHLKWGVSSPLWDIIFRTYHSKTSHKPQQKAA